MTYFALKLSKKIIFRGEKSKKCSMQKTIRNPGAGVKFLARKFKVEFCLKWFFAPKIMFPNNFSIQLKSNYLVMKWIIWHISLNKSVLMRFMQQEKITNFFCTGNREWILSLSVFFVKNDVTALLAMEGFLTRISVLDDSKNFLHYASSSIFNTPKKWEPAT